MVLAASLMAAILSASVMDSTAPSPGFFSPTVSGLSPPLVRPSVFSQRFALLYHRQSLVQKCIFNLIIDHFFSFLGPHKYHCIRFSKHKAFWQ